MGTTEEIKSELAKILTESPALGALCGKNDSPLKFGREYQSWYSRALKLVALLGPDRLDEFRSYYLIAPKRKTLDASNYVIQDYIKGIVAPTDIYNRPTFDINTIIKIRLITQTHIVYSLSSRTDSILEDVEGHLFAEIQDEELNEAKSLLQLA